MPVSTVLERVTITMPAEMTDAIKQAVSDGDYTSTSEVVQDALREWKMRRQLMPELATLKADIDQGLADMAAGRVEPFDLKRIIAQGKLRSAARSN